MRKKTISISKAVWDAIAERGHFNETVDEVLRRVLGINGAKRSSRGARRRKSKDRMPAKVVDGKLQIQSERGPFKEWTLPVPSDKAALKRVREEAFAFAGDNGATEGQLAAISKALNAAGYYVRGKQQRSAR